MIPEKSETVEGNFKIRGSKTKAVLNSIIDKLRTRILARVKAPRSEVQREWNLLNTRYSKLHNSLDKLNTNDDGIIDFLQLSELMDIAPNEIIQNSFDSVCLTCIDERVQSNFKKSLSIGVPGSFCLEKANCPLYAQQIIRDCQQNNIHKLIITPHAQCGAAALAVKKEFESLGWDITSIPQVLVDKKAVEYAESMAEFITAQPQAVNYPLEVSVQFIKESSLYPRTFHNAIGSMVNVSRSDSLDLNKPHIDPHMFNQLIDPMFNIAGFGTDEQIINRIMLSIKIALGREGFGNSHFTSQNPYLILLVTDSKDGVKRAQNSLIKEINIQLGENKNIVSLYTLDISQLGSQQ